MPRYRRGYTYYLNYEQIQQSENDEESNIYDESEKDADADIEDDAIIGEDLLGKDW